MYIIVLKTSKGLATIYARSRSRAMKRLNRLSEEGNLGSWRGHDGIGWESESVNAHQVIYSIPTNPVFTITEI